MQIRVPADKFQESLDEIRKTADRVLVETVSGKDVTEEFVDIEARLKTKKALEERFLEIMKTAKTVQDALNVERQLASVRTEIERIEGRKRFLESQTSLSTINIELQTPIAISASSTGFFYEVKEAISDGFEAALTFILFLIRVLIAILPFLILIVLPVLLLLRYFWRRSKKNRAARRILEEELKEDQIIDVE
jgi:Flp pilus assembly protein TadB